MFYQKLDWAFSAVVLCAAAVFPPAAAAGDTAAAHPEMIVSASWLSEHLKDPKVVVLHVADKRSEYDSGHIPGARFLALKDFIEGQDAELPSPEKLKNAFEVLGVSDDSRIVIYTTAWYPMAGRAYYTLDYLGHGAQAALLDGGIDQWKAEKRQLEKEAPKVARGILTPHLHLEVRAELDAVKKISADAPNSVLLVDSRPEKRYTDGHIAGAAHVYWEETLVDARNNPVFLPPDKLQALFASRGIATGQKLVSYCEIGLQASHIYFIAKYLGYDAAMFDGSIHQWMHMNNLPVVEGKSAR